jgi:hypothetical protein
MYIHNHVRTCTFINPYYKILLCLRIALEIESCLISCNDRAEIVQQEFTINIQDIASLLITSVSLIHLNTVYVSKPRHIMYQNKNEHENSKVATNSKIIIICHMLQDWISRRVCV